MIPLAATGAGEAAGDAIDQRLFIHRQFDHGVQLSPTLVEQCVECVGLRRGARIAVEDRTLFGIGHVQPLTDQRGDDRVGHEFPRLHHGLRLQPDRRAGLDRRTQHIAGGQLDHAAARLQPAGLRTLAGSRRPKQNDVHVAALPWSRSSIF